MGETGASTELIEFGAFVAVAENIRSLHNVGALFRSADGAGISHLFLCGYSGYPPRAEIHKVALGAEHSVPWRHAWHIGGVLDELERRGYELVVLEQCPSAIPLHEFRPRWPLALVVGNEVDGVSPGAIGRAHTSVYIPMRGTKRSLNVSVAFGIAAFRLAEMRD